MDEPPRSRFDELLADVLDSQSGEVRRLRIRELANGDRELESRLEQHVDAFERDSWLDHPEDWAFSDEWFIAPDRTGEWFGRWQVTSRIAISSRVHRAGILSCSMEARSNHGSRDPTKPSK